MKGKLKSATTTWKTTLRSQKEVREKLEEDFGGKKTRRCKNAMKILNKAERNSRAYSKQKYSEKFKNLERTYNKTEKEKDDPILACYPGVSYTDLDLSRRVIVQCDKNVACKSCKKSCSVSNPTPLSSKGKGLGIKTVPGRGGGNHQNHQGGGGAKVQMRMQECMRV